MRRFVVFLFSFLLFTVVILIGKNLETEEELKGMYLSEPKLKQKSKTGINFSDGSGTDEREPECYPVDIPF